MGNQSSSTSSSLSLENVDVVELLRSQSSGCLRNLRSLSLNGCHKLLDVDGGELERVGLQGLERLQLGNSKLETIPKAVESLENLTELNLDGNTLSSLSDVTITRLSSLRILSARYNQLTSNAFGSLRAINFACLGSLASVDLSHNELDAVPSILLGFSSLQVISLRHNRLTALPDFTPLRNLRNLDLCDNQLETLPQTLKQASALKRLVLRDNPLSAAAQALCTELSDQIAEVEAGQTKQGVVRAVQQRLSSTSMSNADKRDSKTDDAGFGEFHLAFENLMESLSVDDKQKLKTKALTIDQKWTLIQSRGFKVAKDSRESSPRSNSPLSQRSMSVEALQKQLGGAREQPSPLRKGNRLAPGTLNRTSSLRKVTAPDGGEKGPKLFVEMLQSGTVTLDDVALLTGTLDEKGLAWKNEFVSLDGANYILQLLAPYITKDGTFLPQEEAMQMALLTCYRSIFTRRERAVVDKVVAGNGKLLCSVPTKDIDEKFALQVVAGNGGWHKGMNPAHAQELQHLSLQMLQTASQVNTPQAAGTVLQAFDYVKQQRNMADGRFDQLMGLLEQNAQGDLRATVLSLINGLISGTDELRQRCGLRKEFLALSLEKHFKEEDHEDQEPTPTRSASGSVRGLRKEVGETRRNYADFKDAMKEDFEEVFERHGLAEVIKLRPKPASAPTSENMMLVLPMITGDLCGEAICLAFEPSTTTVQELKDMVVKNVKEAGKTPISDALVKEFSIHVPTAAADEEGLWLDDGGLTLGSLGLKGEVAAEFKPKPWEVEIIYSDALDKSHSEVCTMDPCLPTGRLVHRLCKQFYGEVLPFAKNAEDFGFFSPSNGFLETRRTKQAGTFIDPTRKLLSYEMNPTKKKVLELRLTPILVPGRVAGGSKSVFRLDPNLPISDVFTLLADKCMIDKAVRADYCLYLHKSKKKKDRDHSRSKRRPAKEASGSSLAVPGGIKSSDRKDVSRHRSPGRIRTPKAPSGSTLTVPGSSRRKAEGEVSKSRGKLDGGKKRTVKELLLDVNKKLRDYPITGADLLVLSLIPGKVEEKSKRMSIMSILQEGVIAAALVGECQKGLPNRYSLYATGESQPTRAESSDDRRTRVLRELRSKFDDLTFNHKLDIGNVWDEPPDGNIEYENGAIRAATLNQLAANLTPDAGNYDRRFVDAFLTTCPTFCTLLQLLAKMVERWEPPKDYCDESTKNCVRMRVLLILKEWAEHYPEFFRYSGESLPPIHLFYELMKIDGHGDQIRAVQQKANSAVVKSPLPDLSIPKSIANSKTTFLDLNSMDIARQICVKTYPTYSAIMPIELLGQAWTKDSLKGLAKNLLSCIDDFNHYSHFVSTMIISEEKVRHRAKVMAKMIDIATKLLQLNNFQILMAFISGLNVSSVSRLKWTSAKMPKSARKSLLHLEELMSMQGSYKIYREMLTKAEPPGIPYLGVVLQDITFIEDGNMDYVVSHMINFTKRWMLYDTISMIRKFQNEPYKFRPLPEVLSVLDQCNPYDDDALYKTSLVREPRNVSRSKIA